MTLSEIETILHDLETRHPNLTKELLTTLLLSAGWEDKSIKDAVTLFIQKPPVVTQNPVVVAPQTKTEITFFDQSGEEEQPFPTIAEPAVPFTREEKSPLLVYHPDTENPKTEEVKQDVKSESSVQTDMPKEVLTSKQVEEKSASVLENLEKIIPTITIVPDPVVTEKHEEVIQKEIVPPQQEVSTPPVALPTVPIEEKQSLVTPPLQQVPPQPQKEVALPENLPVVPFESSPHVWSFAKHKDVYHKEATQEKIPEPVPVTPVMIEDEEIVVEDVPLTKGDESLVFLASVMLLVIILILGYMYSNGRL